MGRWYGKVIDHDHVHSTPAHSQIHIRRLLIGKKSAKQKSSYQDDSERGWIIREWYFVPMQ